MKMPPLLHRSIFGHVCKRATHRNSHKFYGLLNDKRDAGYRDLEPDIEPVFRALVDHYSGADTPILNLGFFDIEGRLRPPARVRTVQQSLQSDHRDLALSVG